MTKFIPQRLKESRELERVFKDKKTDTKRKETVSSRKYGPVGSKGLHLTRCKKSYNEPEIRSEQK